MCYHYYYYYYYYIPPPHRQVLGGLLVHAVMLSYFSDPWLAPGSQTGAHVPGRRIKIGQWATGLLAPPTPPHAVFHSLATQLPSCHTATPVAVHSRCPLS